jgi:hypothetical protein
VLYLDTSVLLVYTLTQSVERMRYAATRAFFAQVKSGALSAATSFHALHEVHLFALSNCPVRLSDREFWFDSPPCFAFTEPIFFLQPRLFHRWTMISSAVRSPDAAPPLLSAD